MPVLELERRLLHDAFGLGAWDQDGRRHTEAEPVEFLGADDVLHRDPAAPSLHELKEVARGLGGNGLPKSCQKRLTRTAEGMAQKQLGLESGLGDAGAAELIRAALEEARCAHTAAIVAGRHD